MSVPPLIDPEDPGGGGTGGGGGGGAPFPGTLPGLGQYLRRRYTSNVVIADEIKGIDLLYDVIFPAFRGFMSQAPNGQIRIRSKRPVDGALGRAAFSPASNILSVDNAAPWISDLKYHLLIDPFTNDSEVRDVIDADYPVSQNSVTLATSHPADITIAGFSGCDGDSTPATASVTIASFTAATTYSVTLDGIEIAFVPTTGDTTESIASFLAGAFKGHPGLNRRFAFSWVDGASVVNITARFGTLEVDSALTKNHVAPVADPTTGPTLTATASGSLLAGDYRVTYAERNEHGQTLLAPFRTVTLTANQKITVTAVAPLIPGNTIVWYTVPEAGSTALRYHSENDGSGFVIDSLPLLSAPFPPDLNRTGTEVMRVKAVFSDRAETRAGMSRSNVLRGTSEWSGDQEDSINRIDLLYREANEDYKLKELRVRNDEHIAKIGKVSPKSINGQAIDNTFQAARIGHGLLAEKRDADFFWQWSSTREALLLEEFDVVAITDHSSGFYNIPFAIETIELDLAGAGLPKVAFSGRLFANWLYDDSVVKREITLISEPPA